MDAAFGAELAATDLLDHHTILYFDAEAQKHIYTLGEASVAIRDRFTGLLSWAYFFDAAGKWTVRGEKAETAEKLAFVDFLTRMQKHLDTHFRSIRAYRHSTALAERYLLVRIDALKNAAIPVVKTPFDEPVAASVRHEREKTLTRLEGALADVRNLRSTIDAWTTRTEEAKSLFRDLAAQAPAGRATVKDLSEFQSLMTRLQTTLDLDPVLVESLKVKRSWF